MNPPTQQPLKTWSLKPGIVYGPFSTRRHGMSLGINLLPGDVKLCTFNCVYCQCGWTQIDPEDLPAHGLHYPSVDEVGRVFGERLAELASAGTIPDAMVLSGNGEPTLHPEFPAVVDRLLAERDRHMPGVKIVLLSDGTGLGDERIRAAIDRLDERTIKVDAGTDDLLRRIGQPRVPFRLDDLVAWVGGLRDVVVQTCFLAGRVSNSTPEAVDAWIQVIGRIRPKWVQIYPLDRIPPAQGLERVSAARLEEIARLLFEKTGVPGKIYGPPVVP